MKPSWLKRRPPSGRAVALFSTVSSAVKAHSLHTICEEAHCPNLPCCWGSGCATFLLMGDVCTRGCSFCSTKKSAKGIPLDAAEPEGIKKAVKELSLSYVVLTSVDRDDLESGGAEHFAQCIRAAKDAGALVEALTPDFQGKEECLRAIADAKPHVLSHNIEAVERLQHLRDRRAGYALSLRVLQWFSQHAFPTKSSILLGLGETRGEVLRAMDDLRGAGVRMLSIGQYLQPTKAQVPVARYVPPDEFDELAEEAKERGFAVRSAPFVRTSFDAEALYREARA